ncbi:MAG: hypothetical protein ACEQSR_14065, partial [Candidatus Methylacidiphilales bacterium]
SEALPDPDGRARRIRLPRRSAREIVFLNDAFNSNVELATILNRFLLLGYYLLNLGYAAVSIHIFSEINSITQLIEELSKRIGMLIIGLALMHYFNMYTFSHFNKQIQKLYSNNH